jgi:RES domain-containing protein
MSAQMPDDLDREEIEEAALVSGWRDYAPYPSFLADLGTAWLMRCSSPILRVPSALIAGEFNYLLNPVHRDFPRIQQGRAIPFEFPRAWEIEHMR